MGSQWRTGECDPSTMAYHGPSYGLSRECAMKAQAKFSPERAKECMTWIEEVTGQKLGDIKDQIDFAEHVKDGVMLCGLINALQPGSVKKINTLKAPFKQRKYRDVPKGLHQLRPEGAGPVPGQRSVRE